MQTLLGLLTRHGLHGRREEGACGVYPGKGHRSGTPKAVDPGVVIANSAAIAASAGVLAPIAGAAVGLIPGCGPHIVLPIDRKAALIATVYTVIPALVIGVLMHYLWEPLLGLARFGFGVL